MAADGAGDSGVWTIMAAIGSVIVNIMVAVGGGIWTLAHSRNATDEKISEKERSASIDMADMERRLKIEIDNSEKSFGETVSALRQHVNGIELWNRDNFVDKVTFQTVVGDLRRWGERFEDNINDRFDQISQKLDRNMDQKS